MRPTRRSAAAVLSSCAPTSVCPTKLRRVWCSSGRQRRVPVTRLAYPGTTLSMADVRARLILVSIMEGSLRRARDELRGLRALASRRRGTTGRARREVCRGPGEPDRSRRTMARARSRPRIGRRLPAPPAARKVVPRTLDLGPQAWEPISLGEPLAADVVELARVQLATHRRRRAAAC